MQITYCLPVDNADGTVVECKQYHSGPHKGQIYWAKGPHVGIIRIENIPTYLRPGYRKPASMMREANNTSESMVGMQVQPQQHCSALLTTTPTALQIGILPVYASHWLFQGNHSVPSCRASLKLHAANTAGGLTRY